MEPDISDDMEAGDHLQYRYRFVKSHTDLRRKPIPEFLLLCRVSQNHLSDPNQFQKASVVTERCIALP